MLKTGLNEDSGRVVQPVTISVSDDALDLVSALQIYAPDNPERQVGLAVVVTMMIAKSNNLPKELIIDLLDRSWKLSSAGYD
jgi:hypothetical protein